MDKEKKLTQLELKRIFYYNEFAGVFTRLITTGNRSKAGSIPGWVQKFPDGKSYASVSINSLQYRLHRLIFLYKTGSFPAGHVDHIDGNGLNNKWANLRQSNPIENSKNRRLSKNNTSGMSGVYWNKKDAKWRSQIRTGNKCIDLGSFDKKNDAVNARKTANVTYGFHANHGSVRPL